MRLQTVLVALQQGASAMAQRLRPFVGILGPDSEEARGLRLPSHAPAPDPAFGVGHGAGSAAASAQAIERLAGCEVVLIRMLEALSDQQTANAAGGVSTGRNGIAVLLTALADVRFSFLKCRWHFIGLF